MATDGIGARVLRKEDRRFITGRGRYTDDINRPGQAYAVFVRSPHAHARINGIDKSHALAAPGVLAVLTGDDVAADKIGGLICGWMVKSKDGSDMKAGPHPILAQGKVALRRRSRRLCGRRELPSGQGCSGAGRGRLRGAAGLRLDRARARRRPTPGPRRHPSEHGLRVGTR